MTPRFSDAESDWIVGALTHGGTPPLRYRLFRYRAAMGLSHAALRAMDVRDLAEDLALMDLEAEAAANRGA